MDAGPLRDVLTLVAGVSTGVLSAAFGVGGAVVSTPAIRALGASAAIAIGTTLPSILPSAATGTVRYTRERLVVWRVVAWTVPSGIVASVGGSLLSKVVPGHGHILMLMTAALLAFTAWRMMRSPARAGEAAGAADLVADQAGGAVDRAPDRAGGAVDRAADPTAGRAADRGTGPDRARAGALFGIGVAAGGLSGLLGIGGGVLMVPSFVELADLPVHTAVATSLVCVGVFAIPGTITHALIGDIDWRFALWLSAGVIPGARIGAAAAMRATDRRLRLSVGFFLGGISLLYAAGELLALVR